MDVKKIVYYEANFTEDEYKNVIKLAGDKIAAGTATQEDTNMANFLSANL